MGRDHDARHSAMLVSVGREARGCSRSAASASSSLGRGRRSELRARAALELPQPRQEEEHADDTRSRVIVRHRRQRKPTIISTRPVSIEYQPALSTLFDSRAETSVRKVVMDRAGGAAVPTDGACSDSAAPASVDQ